MKRRDEVQYLKTLLKEIDQSLKAYDKEGRQNQLHEFRVSVKKLKAFLILADSTGSKSKLLKKFPPIGRIFRRAGKIRSAAINMKIDCTLSLKKEQRNLLVAADKKFKRNSNHYRQEIKHAGSRLKVRIRPINDVHISLFYEKHLQQIAGFLAHSDFSASLHECRKQLKILLYNYKLVGRVLDIKLNEKYIDQLQQAVGDWHDTVEAGANNLTDSSLNGKQQQCKAVIAELRVDFYERATTVNEIPIEQID